MKNGISVSQTIKIVEKMSAKKARTKEKEGDEKGKNGLWYLAKEAESGDKAIVRTAQYLAEMGEPVTGEDLRVHAQAGEDEGKTLLWLLVNAATYGNDEPFHYFWKRCHKSLTLKDIRAQAQRGWWQGQTIFWVSAVAAIYENPAVFIAIWEQFATELQFSDMKMQARAGNEKGRNIWHSLAEASKNGHIQPFMLAWGKFSKEVPPKEILSSLLIRDVSGDCPLALLGHAASYGNLLPFLEVIKHLKEHMTLKDWSVLDQNDIPLYALAVNIIAEGYPDIFLELVNKFSGKFPWKDLLIPLKKGFSYGRSLFLFLAVGVANKVTEPFNQAWRQLEHEVDLADIQVEDSAGSSLLWLLAMGGNKGCPEPFRQVWARIKNKATIKDILVAPKLGDEKDLSVLFLLAESSKEYPEDFLEVWEQYKEQITLKDLLYYPLSGRDKGRSILWVLIVAAIEGTPQPFMAVWRKINTNLPATHLIIKGERADYSGCSMMRLLVNMVSNHFIVDAKQQGRTFDLEYLFEKKKQKEEKDQFYLQLVESLIAKAKLLPQEKKGEYLKEMAQCQFLDILTVDEAKQQARLSFYGEDFPVGEEILEEMLNENIRALGNKGLLQVVTYKRNQVAISLLSQGERNISLFKCLQSFTEKNTWLESLRFFSEHCKLTIVPGENWITLKRFYQGFNDLQLGLVALSQETKKESTEVPVLSAPPPSPVMVDTIRYEQYLPSQTKEKSKIKSSVIVCSSSLRPKKKINPQETKKSQKTLFLKRKESTSPRQTVQCINHEEKYPSKVSTSSELPALAPYRLLAVPTLEKNYPTQEEQKEKAHLQKEAGIKVQPENDRLRRLMLARTAQLSALKENLGLDEYTAYLIFDLAAFDIVCKINRDLKSHHFIYEFDCNLIHSTHQALALDKPEANLEHSILRLFVQACYLKDGFKLLDGVTLDKQTLSQLSKKISAEPETSAATYSRLRAIQTLLHVLLVLQRLIEKEAFEQEWLQHALSATFIILGEQYARLSKMVPSVAKELTKNATIKNIFEKYKRYRNLRHGPEIKRVDLHTEEAPSITATFHYDEEWEDIFPILLQGFREDLTHLHHRNIQDPLHGLMETYRLEAGLGDILMAQPLPVIHSDSRQNRVQDREDMPSRDHPAITELVRKLTDLTLF